MNSILSFVGLILSVLAQVLVSNEAARILAMIPTPSISHQVVFRPLIQELVKRGHELVVITTDPAFPEGKAPANLTEINVHDVSYKMWRESFVRAATGKKEDLITQLTVSIKVMIDIFQEQIKCEEVQTILQDKSRGFDLIIVEAWVKSPLGLAHVFKAPVIQMSSFCAVPDNHKVIGAPFHLLLYPMLFRQRVYNLTWIEKIREVYNQIKIQNFVNSLEDEENKMLKELFGPDTPTINELENRVDMLFLNEHPVWKGNQPVPPGVIHIGGLHHKPEKKLPQDLKSYLDASINGVIYMSFGTNTNPSSLPPEKIKTFVRVFSKLPYDVLWKWNEDELPGRSKNIRIGKWFPQSDLLRHPNIKLFVTQGGLQSTDEAIAAGVPLIGIPMVGDQWLNVDKYVYHKIGVNLDLVTLTDEIFETAIKTVIQDGSYRRNVIALNTLMRDEPQTPLERAVWWTEHVLRHGGGRHLRAPAANMSWWDYLELELVFTLLLVLLAVILVSLSVPYLLYKHFSRLNVKVKKN